MEKYPAADAAEMIEGINALAARWRNMHFVLPEGLSHFAFRRLSEKQKKP